MRSVILYTTLGCHLCEQANALIKPLLAECDWQLQEVDIADDNHLMARYGIRIPVLAIPNTGIENADNANNADIELDWPFTANDIASRLQSELPMTNNLSGNTA